MTEYYTEADAWPRSPGLQPIEFRSMPNSHPDDLPEPPDSSSCSESSGTSTRKRQRKRRKKKIRPSQGDVVLLNYLAPNYPDIARQAGHQTIVSEPEDESDPSDEDISDADLANNGEDSEDEDGDKIMSSPVKATQTSSIHQPVPASSSDPADPGLDSSNTMNRVSQHSMNSQVKTPNQYPSPVLKAEIDRPYTRSTSRRDRERSDANESIPLNNKLETGRSMSPTQGTRRYKDDVARCGPNGTDTIATSPTLRPHLIPPASRSPRQMLPAIYPESPAIQDACGSPEQQLPSVVKGLIRGIAPEYDAVCGRGRPRTTSLPSAGPGHTLSPILLARPFPPGPESPIRYPPPSTHATPSTMYSDQSSPDQFGILSPSASVTSPPGPEMSYRSLQQPAAGLKFPPSLHSASSSNTSNPSTGSSSDGFTPSSHATPNDKMNTISENPGKPHRTKAAEVRHQPASTQNGLYQCKVPGCTAAPFHTQYLLNSHANVHSEKRPHYCPVKDCAHSEGGSARGFKRKNEMNRHQLVHTSPKYVCPFCPDQKRKYPRPDNLLRHVTRHHKDKSKDDPALRDVLNQHRPVATGQAVVRGQKV